jgi:hypothetical protein
MRRGALISGHVAKVGNLYLSLESRHFLSYLPVSAKLKLALLVVSLLDSLGDICSFSVLGGLQIVSWQTLFVISTTSFKDTLGAMGAMQLEIFNGF